MTRTRNITKVLSRDAVDIQYQPHDNLYVSQNGPVGVLSIGDLGTGKQFSTVQGAIDDLVTLIAPPIGTVITTTGASPGGVQQTQTLVFEGTCTKDTIIKVFGLPIKIKLNSSSTVLLEAVRESFESYIDKNLLFTKVEYVHGLGNHLKVTMIDYKYHPPFTYESDGMKVYSSITSPHSYGYAGSWTKLGTETKFGKTLNYWERKV